MFKNLLVGFFLFSACPFAQSAEVFFSPDGGVRDQILKHINLAKSTIDIAVYSFTAGEIADALANAEKRGVRIRLIRDRSQSSDKNDENKFLEKNGVQIKVRTGKGRGIMHDKFAVFDNKIVFTGSYNWTENAEHNNFENALFIDDVGLSASYEREFEHLWDLPEVQKKKRGKNSHRH